MDSPRNQRFLYLVGKEHDLSEDDKHDAYVAILEADPATEEDAKAILRKLHHRKEWKRRRDKKRNCKLLFDPPAPQFKDSYGFAIESLQRLSSDDAALIRSHIIDERTMQDIANESGVSRQAIRKRYRIAMNKLRELVE